MTSGNAPRDLPGNREGDLIQFMEAEISDWMFMRNGKIAGETIKPRFEIDAEG